MLIKNSQNDTAEEAICLAQMRLSFRLKNLQSYFQILASQANERIFLFIPCSKTDGGFIVAYFMIFDTIQTPFIYEKIR